MYVLESVQVYLNNELLVIQWYQMNHFESFKQVAKE